MVSTETELEAAAPGGAFGHGGDPQTGAGAVAICGGPLPHTE